MEQGCGWWGLMERKWHRSMRATRCSSSPRRHRLDTPYITWCPAESAAQANELKVTESSLENARYRVIVDKSGDVSSIVDKKTNKEILSAPVRLAFQTEKPKQWPAWNMDWEDQQKPPRSYVSGPAKVRIVERGPVRVALEITRESEGSKFVQKIQLSAGEAGQEQ